MATIPYTTSEATESDTRTKNTATATKSTATETKKTTTGTKNTPAKPLTDDQDAASNPTATSTTTTETKTTTTSSEKFSLATNLTTNSTSSGLELRPYLALIIAVLVI